MERSSLKKQENHFGMSDFIADLIYGSYIRVADKAHGLDSATRDLSYTQELLDELDIKSDLWLRATVTGSKGKGSVSVLLASILAASGEKVGLVTSPHLRQFNERIRIDGQCVSMEELEWAGQKIAPAVQSITKRIPPPKYLGPGGVILALAYTLFAKNKITIAVFEAGRGGEFDESRLVKAPVSVLTPIMLEHSDKLGPTIESIAITKTRITSPGSVIISSPQSRSAQKAIHTTARELKSEVREVSVNAQVVRRNHQDQGVTCDILVGKTQYSNLSINLGGLHQADNAATAILAAHALSEKGANVSREGIYSGLKKVQWPGRAQVLQQKPWVFLDGAINEDSAKYSCNVVSQFPAKKITAVLAVPKPKDLVGVCREVSKLTQHAIITEVSNPALVWYEDAQKIASTFFLDAKKIVSAKEAFQLVMDQSTADDGILLLGTQSFLGEALDYWDVNTCKLW